MVSPFLFYIALIYLCTMKWIIFLNLLCFATSWAFSQDEIDVLRYAQIEVGGTARTMGVSGAFGALGADFAMTSVNPAGVGVYRRSEFSITPGAYFQKTKADFEESLRIKSLAEATLYEAGAVFASLNRDKEKRWKSFNFALGFNRLATFSDTYEVNSRSTGSITERFLDDANANFINVFDTQLALDTDLIYSADSIGSDCPCLRDIQLNQPVEKNIIQEKRGAIGEFTMTVGGRFMKKLYVGVSIGIPLVSYNVTNTYRESDVGNAIPVFNQLVYTESLITNGAGFNLKLGAIYKVKKRYRVGLALHSMTTYGLTDAYNTSMEANLTYPMTNVEQTNFAESPPGAYSYGIRTPWRVIASQAVILPNFGFVSFDAEWLNYKQGRLEIFLDQFPTDGPYGEEINSIVQANYKHAMNLRTGVEYAKRQFRLRAGYAYYGSPYKKEIISVSGNKHQFSFGAGYLKERLSIDFAWVQTFKEDIYTPYQTNNYQPSVQIKRSIGMGLITAGFRFNG